MSQMDPVLVQKRKVEAQALQAAQAAGAPLNEEEKARMAAFTSEASESHEVTPENLDTTENAGGAPQVPGVINEE